MAPRNAALTEHDDRIVSQVLAGGRFQDMAEVVREALRLLERRETDDAAKMARLRGAVAEAEAALCAITVSSPAPAPAPAPAKRANS